MYAIRSYYDLANWIQWKAQDHYIPDGPIDRWATLAETLDATIKLNGENYVFWGGREGYMSLLNTDMKREVVITSYSIHYTKLYENPSVCYRLVLRLETDRLRWQECRGAGCCAER